MTIDDVKHLLLILYLCFTRILTLILFYFFISPNQYLAARGLPLFPSSSPFITSRLNWLHGWGDSVST